MEKYNVKYSEDEKMNEETKKLLKEIILSNDSKWIIAQEAYFLCVKQFGENINKK